MGEWARGVSAMILKLMGRGVIVFSARIVNFVVESVVTGSAIGQSLLGSGKGVGQSGPFTVGNARSGVGFIGLKGFSYAGAIIEPSVHTLWSRCALVDKLNGLFGKD